MPNEHNTDLLIIGAGPYGLAMAMVARANNIDYLIVGKLMEFWKSHMPSGMCLRTSCDWYTQDNLEDYLHTLQIRSEDINPVPVEFFTTYIENTVTTHPLALTQSYVEQLDREKNSYRARLTNGDIIYASNVLVATGFYNFRNIPDEFRQMLPEGAYSHTSDLNEFKLLTGNRCLIIGGRQSAFEWAGLMNRYTASVDMVYRHDTPDFKPSDWSWANPYIEETQTNPGWFRRLAKEEQEKINKRFWKEGRLELEDWLLNRLDDPKITLWPNSTILNCVQSSAGSLKITLSNGNSLEIDHVILATGYQVDIRKVSFISGTNIMDELECDNGYPKLDDALQSSLPGLYFTGIHAVNDFGPFLFFVAGAFASAEIIAAKIRNSSKPE